MRSEDKQSLIAAEKKFISLSLSLSLYLSTFFSNLFRLKNRIGGRSDYEILSLLENRDCSPRQKRNNVLHYNVNRVSFGPRFPPFVAKDGKQSFGGHD